MHTNELIHESSPYLQQHAHNPVDWHPWGDNAFALARLADKPVFLSIGYSTCHWCHVMEHECFSDEEVAAAMNKTFISIKVDREERPDIDQVYMQAAQMMTGGGGWPLNVLLTPEGKPFYAATYLPKHSGHGRMGLIELSQRVQQLWQHDREKLLSSAEQLHQNMQRQQQSDSAGDEPVMAWVEQAWRQLASEADKAYGGFGDAPKFPTAHKLMLMLRQVRSQGDASALAHVEKTLDQMRAGGIFDQLGYGFHRYSTDARWLVPHFEKMLYDQAMLMMVYSEAAQLTGHARHARVVEEIADYVLRDMRRDDGLFFSAEDADSEGEEGLFYLWKSSELKQLLGKNDAALAMQFWHIEQGGNYLDEARRMRNGRNILHRDPTATMTPQLETIRQRLLRTRQQRPRPFRDEKVLTDWNGLMIAALAKASVATKHEDWYHIASHAMQQLLQQRLDAQQRLWHHRSADGKQAVAGQLDDYAFVIWGLLELYEAGFDAHFLQQAIALNQQLLAHFSSDDGGFFLTADDAEPLLIRPNDAWDGALPSGSAVTVYNLIRLARLTGDPALEDRAMQALKTSSRYLQQAPSAQAFMLLGLWQALTAGYELVIAGDEHAAQQAGRQLQQQFYPDLVILRRDALSQKLAPYSIPQKPSGQGLTFYLCSDHQCDQPRHELAVVRQRLKR